MKIDTNLDYDNENMAIAIILYVVIVVCTYSNLHTSNDQKLVF